MKKKELRTAHEFLSKHSWTELVRLTDSEEKFSFLICDCGLFVLADINTNKLYRSKHWDEYVNDEELYNFKRFCPKKYRYLLRRKSFENVDDLVSLRNDISNYRRLSKKNVIDFNTYRYDDEDY